jgi:hypothetical protein
VNILDENIPAGQRRQLELWRLHVRQIGFNIGRSGMKDEEIIPFLQQQHRSTFFTRDVDFFDNKLCHPRYSLIDLAVDKNESALFVRRTLRHPELKSQAKRMAAVVQVSHSGILILRTDSKKPTHATWDLKKGR